MFGTQAIRKEGRGWSDHALCERVDGENPLQAVEICGKGHLQMRQRVIDYRLIENAHERAKDDNHDYNPLVGYFAALAASTRKLHGQSSCVRNQSMLQ